MFAGVLATPPLKHGNMVADIFEIPNSLRGGEELETSKGNIMKFTELEGSYLTK